MSAFTTTKSNIGDLSIETGVVLDLIAGTTEIFSIANFQASANVPDPETSVIRSAPRFAGGSSRNFFIEEIVVPNVIPNGWFKQTKKYEWASELGGFTIEVGSDGSLEWSDGTDVIMTAPPGTIPLDDRVQCSAGVASGSGNMGTSEYTIDLGTATGLVTLNFEAFTVPDIFIVEYDGASVINTGYRGVSGTYDGVAVTVAGPGLGSASFTKSTANPTSCTVRIEAPFTGTAWEFDLSCPGGGAPPYTPSSSGRQTFTATSTAYGNSLNYGYPFTVDVIYEGGQTLTQIALTSEVLFTSNPLIMEQDSVTRWGNYGDFRVDIDDTGEATISDRTDVVAIRPTVVGAEQYLDPSGSYEATAHGRDTYNLGVEFFCSISMIPTAPLELYTFLKLILTGGAITDVRGPFSEFSLPANATNLKILPISYSNGLGTVEQFFEGAVLWK
jgi:hypothetical protein